MKQIRIFLLGLIIITIYFGCSKRNDYRNKQKIKLITVIVENLDQGVFLSFPEKILLDSKNDIWILNGSIESLYKFSSTGNILKKIKLKTGKGPGEFSKFGIRSFDIIDNKIAILDGILHRITFIDETGKYLSSFPYDFNAFEIEYVNNCEILLLGKKDSKIFHQYNMDGELVRSFGEQIDENPIVLPTCMTINDDIIYIVSPSGYNIVKYLRGIKEDIYRGKRELIGYEIKELPNGAIGLIFPSGVNGLVYSNDLLYATTYDGFKKEFYLDVFSTKSGNVINSIKLESWSKISYIDESFNLYFIKEDKIEKCILE